MVANETKRNEIYGQSKSRAAHRIAWEPERLSLARHGHGGPVAPLLDHDPRGTRCSTPDELFGDALRRQAARYGLREGTGSISACPGDVPPSPAE